MKKIKSFLAAAILLVTAFVFTSCELLWGYLDDYLGDTFSGPENTWLEMTVPYDDGEMLHGNVNLAFFYTTQDRTGHSTNNTRLFKDYTIPAGLTVLCYGTLTFGNTGLSENAYFIKTFPIEEDAKTEWNLIYNMSAPLRKLEKKGTVDPEVGDSWITGENYGAWSTYHPEDDVAIAEGQERVPAPLTNQSMGSFLTNDQFTDDRQKVDWDDALAKINIRL